MDFFTADLLANETVLYLLTTMYSLFVYDPPWPCKIAITN